MATGIGANFLENDDVTNDVGDGFGLGLGSSDNGSPGLMCVLVNDASCRVGRENLETCEFAQWAKQCVERHAAGAVGEIKTVEGASESAPGTASSSTLDELRAAIAVIDELHRKMLQISLRDHGIGTACA